MAGKLFCYAAYRGAQTARPALLDAALFVDPCERNLIAAKTM